MTQKNLKELQEQKNLIIERFNLKVSVDLKTAEINSIQMALIKALNESDFIRVKKQLINVLNVIEYAIESDLINSNEYIEIQFTKNFINRGALVGEILKPFKNYYNSIGKNLKIHLIDNNNSPSIKKHTTNETAILVDNNGIQLNNVSACNYDYALTSDKNKKVIKRLKEINKNNNYIVEW